MKSIRLTKQAQEQLVNIAEWTFHTFGPRQAEAYEKDLIQCCERIGGGVARRQSCTALVDGIDKDLFFTRAGQHFVVFLERKDDVIIVDFLHSRSDLPAKLRHIGDRME